jgi:hypothetical protein
MNKAEKMRRDADKIGSKIEKMINKFHQKHGDNCNVGVDIDTEFHEYGNGTRKHVSTEVYVSVII